MGKMRDLTNQKFERLTVISATEKRDASGSIVWECRCDCGNPEPVFVSSKSLLSGSTKSCGCLKIETLVKHTRLDLKGQKFGRLEAVRLTDKRKDGSAVWECQCDCGNPEPVFVKASSLKNGGVKSCGCLNRVVAKEMAKQKASVDCVDGTRISFLTKSMYGHNTSGRRGVSFNKASGKWMASITFKKETYYLGIYEDIEQAAAIRKMAEDLLWKPLLEEYLGSFQSEKERIEKTRLYIKEHIEKMEGK